MKKTLSLLIISLLVFNHLYAQAENKTRFGLKGGLNHTVINGIETDGDKTGFIGSSIYGAFFTDFRIGATTFFNTELLFSWTNDWHFIEIPLHLQQMINPRLGMFIGPKFGFSANKIDKQKEDKSGVLGLSVETGAQYNFSRRLFAEGRYSIGLSRQFRDELFDINEGRRNNLRFGIGFRF